MFKIQVVWWLITLLSCLLYYMIDESHYQVIGVMYILFYSLILDLLFVVGRYVYLKTKRK